jgi:hypothetical protein
MARDPVMARATLVMPPACSAGAASVGALALDLRNEPRRFGGRGDFWPPGNFCFHEADSVRIQQDARRFAREPRALLRQPV